MNTQIALRLPADLVDFLDEQVAAGIASSRAALVADALERERRRQDALRDVAIFRATTDDDLSGLADFATRNPPRLP